MGWRLNGLTLQMADLPFAPPDRQTACTTKWSRAHGRWRGQQLPAQQGGSWGGSSRCLLAQSRYCTLRPLGHFQHAALHDSAPQGISIDILCFFEDAKVNWLAESSI